MWIFKELEVWAQHKFTLNRGQWFCFTADYCWWSQSSGIETTPTHCMWRTSVILTHTICPLSCLQSYHTNKHKHICKHTMTNPDGGKQRWNMFSPCPPPSSILTPSYILLTWTKLTARGFPLMCSSPSGNQNLHNSRRALESSLLLYPPPQQFCLINLPCTPVSHKSLWGEDNTL